MKKVQRAGFTLIELLVVLAIISVLIGIVFASTGGVREKGRQSHCLSNLRQIAMAFRMYVQDNDVGDDPVLLSHIEGQWDIKLNPYMRGAEGVYRCLSDSKSEDNYPVSYAWCIYKDPPPLPTLPSFVSNYRSCGDSLPLLLDTNHNFPDPNLPRKPSTFTLFVRMDGSASGKNIKVGTPLCEY